MFYELFCPDITNLNPISIKIQNELWNSVFCSDLCLNWEIHPIFLSKSLQSTAMQDQLWIGTSGTGPELRMRSKASRKEWKDMLHVIIFKLTEWVSVFFQSDRGLPAFCCSGASLWGRGTYLWTGNVHQGRLPSKNIRWRQSETSWRASQTPHHSARRNLQETGSEKSDYPGDRWTGSPVRKNIQTTGSHFSSSSTCFVCH